MSENDRDTHFQGFAKLLIDRLLDNTEGYFLLMRDVEKKHDMEEAIRVIAQSAWDFSEHVLSEAPMTEYSTDSTYITDLIAWSEASSG